MTREDSLLTKTWVTNDGRYLDVVEITDDHLRAIESLLRRELTPGRNEGGLRTELAAWMDAHARGTHAFEDEMDLDLYRAGWLQIIGDEFARRTACTA